MARFIIGYTYEKKEELKKIGCKYDVNAKMWYLREPKNKAEKIELENKMSLVLNLGFKISEPDNLLQKMAGKRIGLSYN